MRQKPFFTDFRSFGSELNISCSEKKLKWHGIDFANYLCYEYVHYGELMVESPSLARGNRIQCICKDYNVKTTTQRISTTTTSAIYVSVNQIISGLKL